MSLSGTLYSDEGVTALTGSAKTIRIAVGTTTVSVHSTTTVSASGAWTFDLGAGASLATSTPILVWVDSDATTRAALLTKASSTQSITGLDLYQNRVIVRHEATSATTTTLTDLAFYDADNDSDIQYTSNNGALTVFAGQELHVWPGKTFTASGTVEVRGNAGSGTDGSLHLPGTAAFTMVGTTTLAGNFTASSSATFSNATATLLMNATTTGKTLSVPATTLGAVRFNGSGGGWTFGTTSTTTDLTISAGTVVAPATTLAITGDYTNSGTFTHNSGTVYAGSLTTAQTFSGTMTGSSAFNNLLVAGTSTVVSNGLIGYWKFDENTGTTAGDASVSGKDGTLTNGPTWTTGQIESGVRFDGVDDYIEVGSSSGLADSLSQFSVSTWFKTSSSSCATTNCMIVSKLSAGSSATGIGWALSANYNGGTMGQLFFFVQGPTNSDWRGKYTTASYNDGLWHQVTATYDSGTITLYVDGAPVTTGTDNGGTIGAFSNAVNVKIGADTDGSYFPGSVDETRLYNRILSAEEAGSIYTGSAAPKTFANNASTTNLTIDSGEFVAPTSLSIAGNYTNNGAFTHNNGTVYVDGSTTAQTFSGTMTGSSAFSTLRIVGTSTQPTDSDLVGYWSFDSADISGTTAYDRSGAGNNGTLTNGPVPTTGMVQEGLNFDGAADYVTMGSPASLDDIVALTSCAWIYPETLPGSGASTIITEKTSGTGGWAFGVMNSGGTLVYGLYRDFSTYDGYWFGDQTLPLNTWTHLCFTYNNSSVSNDPVFYVNGVPTGTTEYYTPIGTAVSDAPSVLVTGAYLGANYFDGTIDEVRIYDRVLSGTDVDVLYDAATKEKKTFSGNASTTNLTIDSGEFIAPTVLSIAGNYTNNGTFTHNSGTVYLDSLTTAQTLSGTMTGTSTFNNLIVAGMSASVSDGLIGHWIFDENTGTEAGDSSGVGSDGTLTNGPAWVAGHSGTAIDFDETNDYVTMGSPAQYDNLGPVTVSMWIKPDSVTASPRVLMGKVDSGANYGWNVGQSGSGPGKIFVQGLFSGGSMVLRSNDYVLSAGQWQHVTFTFDGTTSYANQHIYVNGVEVGYDTGLSTNGSGTIDDSPYDLILGRDGTAGAYLYGGSMDEVRVYDRVLSAAEVESIYASSGTSKTFTNNASTTNLTIGSGEVVAPTSLSIAGNYTNNGTFTAGVGTMYFSGNGAQIATGTLSSSSSLYNVSITNTATTTFGAPLTVTGTFTDTTPGSALVFTQSATSTFATTTITGTSGSEVKLRSLSSGTQFGFDVNGTYSLTYLDVKDSHACGANAGGDLTTTSSIDSGNNTCWSFGGGAETPITLSGILYFDEGATQITSGKTIKAAIGTSTVSVHSTTTNAGTGAFSLTIPAGHSIGASTPILVWVDGDATTRAALLTKATSTSNMSNLDLYKDRLIVSHGASSGTSTTLTDLAFYDADDDSDIQYTSNSGALTVFAGQELHVWSGKTFTASGTVEVRGNAGSGTDGSLHLPGTASFTMVGTTTLAGNFTASSSATFSNATATLLMNATTTGKTLSVPATTLGAVRFNGSGGGWTFGTTSTTTDLTISAGTVVAPATTLAITGDYTNSGTFTHNSGTVYAGSLTTAQTFSGTMTGSSAFNNLLVAGTSTSGTSNGLIGYWMFDENTGTTASDSSGVGSSGTLTNGPTWATGYSGTAVDLDGTNDYVTMGSPAAYDNIGPVTVSMWVKPDSVTASPRVLMGKTDSGANLGWNVGQSGSGPGKIFVQGLFSGSTMVLRSNDYVLSAGTWQHVAFTFDGTTAYANQHIYVNGTEVGYDTGLSTNGSGTIDDSSYDLMLGRDGSAGSYVYGGPMDEVRLYDRVLSAGEIADIYASSAMTSKTLAQNASTTNLTINSGEFVAPASLSIAGNYTNNGTFTAGTGTTTLSGTSAQTLSGTMTGSSAFGNLVIANTSGSGDATQSVTFANVASTTDTLTMRPGTSAKFPANATSTFQNVSLAGSSGQYVWLRSSSVGTRYAFYVPGTQKLVTYVNVKDSSACPTTMLATDGTSIDGGNNLCWSFPTSATISSASNQSFAYGQATTTIDTITITDSAVVPTITAANDIRIVIATSTTNMHFDTTDTTATFGGTASAKVANPVSYLGDGAVLVIPVSSDFSAGDTLTISDLSFARFEGLNAAASALGVRVAGVGTTTSAVDDKTVTISGTLTASEHSAGQVENSFTSSSKTNIPLYRFALATIAEEATISSLVITAGSDGVSTGDVSNVKLYRDNDADGSVGTGDTQVGGDGAVALASSGGTMTFSTSFVASTTQKHYVLTGTVSGITVGDQLSLALSGASITAAGATSGSMTHQGTVSTVDHVRGGGGGTVSLLIGGPAPVGDGIVTGGGAGGGDAVDPDSGDTIGHEVGFNAPSAHGSPLGAWTTGANAYASDGVYMTTSSNGAQHSLGSFNFSVPEDNEITGIEVKIEASGSTAAGTISGRLSWNGGGSVTSLTTTGTLGLTDAVHTLGSPSDTWGHSWTASEFTNGNFTLELVANTSANTLRVDAVQVKVYHQSTGGSQGGGGGPIIYQGNSHLFASAYGALGESVGTALSTFIRWLARS